LPGFHRLAPREQRIEQATDGALEMFESSVELGIVAAVLDDPARMRRGRPVASEQRANLGE
jgi:hypothetical protein